MKPKIALIVFICIATIIALIVFTLSKRDITSPSSAVVIPSNADWPVHNEYDPVYFIAGGIETKVPPKLSRHIIRKLNQRPDDISTKKGPEAKPDGMIKIGDAIYAYHVSVEYRKGAKNMFWFDEDIIGMIPRTPDSDDIKKEMIIIENKLP